MNLVAEVCLAINLLQFLRRFLENSEKSTFVLDVLSTEVLEFMKLRDGSSKVLGVEDPQLRSLKCSLNTWYCAPDCHWKRC